MKRTWRRLQQWFSPVLSAMTAGTNGLAGWLRGSKQWLVRHKMVLLMVLLVVGGALGTVLRYWLSKWLNAGRTFPYGTFFVNVTGSFILGAAAVIITEKIRPGHENWYFFIGTGFCGGYTTFSTFEWETFKLVRDGLWWYALANVFASILAGFLGILLAVGLVNMFSPEP